MSDPGGGEGLALALADGEIDAEAEALGEILADGDIDNRTARYLVSQNFFERPGGNAGSLTETDDFYGFKFGEVKLFVFNM